MSDATKVKSINEKEEEVLAFWEKNHIFQKSIETPAGEAPQGDFSFYDGPPFATGLPHFGHILAGTIKDAIPRYQTMNGKSVRRVWGWDCHGLPIENLIEKKLGLKSKKDIEDYGIGKFNKEAHDSILHYDAEWKKIIPRLGRFVDMSLPYKTVDATYTESIWWAWKTLFDKGLAYEGNKMMHICPRCETTLAQSEVGMNYEDVTDISVTAKFELANEPGTYILAWTTTPWTLPGNVALAVKSAAVYEEVEIREEGKSIKFIGLATYTATLFSDKEVLGRRMFAGKELVGKFYKPVFPYFENVELENKENIWRIWDGDFVTIDTGTGIVHIAPAFGEDDMDLAKKENLPVIKHVKFDGTFTKEVVDFAGMKVKVAGDTQSADIEIIKWLAHNGKLFEKKKLVHSYPLCYRCKTPLLNYATSSWFVDVPKIKEKLLLENKSIGWTPEHIRDGRFGHWLEGAREWAVSRTRYWGAPLPVWKCDDCEQVKVVGSLKELAEGKKPNNTYYVMRHGQSESNVAGVIDCDGDHTNHLTSLGIDQVKQAAEVLKDKHIDLIIASPFLRTKQTAEIIAEALGGVTIQEEERIKEFNLGIYDKRKVSDYLEEIGELRYLKLDMRVEGGETHREMMHRSMAVFKEVEEKYSGKNILFVTHGGPARMLIIGTHLITEEELATKEAADIGSMYPNNAEVRKLEPYIVPLDETGAVNLHRPYIDEVTFTCSCGKTMKRIPDVFDCWFESGSMPFAQLHYPFENKDIFDKNFPADFIAEGLDQTRGWFYSLINLGVGLFDKAPYKHVIVNGMVMASDGKKMSKSENNYTDPMHLVTKYGADAVRYALISSPLVKGENVSFLDDNVDEAYKKIISRTENVLSLYTMNEEAGVIPSRASSHILDAWIINRISELVATSTKGYTSYALDDAVRGIDSFVDDLSVWYVRRSRDRLKGDAGEQEKKSAYETLKYVLLTFAKVIAPSLPFLAERIYLGVGGERESVHLEKWPEVVAINPELNKEMKEVRDIVSIALMKRTASKIGVRQPLAKLFIPQDIRDEYKKIIADELNVKEVVIGNDIELDTVLTEELIKEGHIRNLIREIQDARKEHGLSPKNSISVRISLSKEYVGNELERQLTSVCKIREVIFAEESAPLPVSFEII